MNINRLSEDVTNFTYTKINESLGGYVDIDVLQWLIWLLYPVFLTFLLPLIIIILFYLSAFMVHVYRHRYKLKVIQEAYKKGDLWEGCRQAVAVMWDAHGWIWHGYEVVGMDNIPDEGGALIVYYHGAIPLDYYYLLAKCILFKGRLIQAVGDRFLFSIPGWKLMMEVFHVFPGTIPTCVDVLSKGELLSIAPGGVREAQFGDSTYQLIWGNRIGFAKVALEAKVPIIPVFTVNLREAFRSLGVGQSLFKKIYDKTRLPLVPIYGGFPVKLKTIIGKPIPYDPSLNAQELADKTARIVEDMIFDNQRLPGSIFKALIDRVYWTPKKTM
ncbi:Transmembrane protein 68 [Halotydeus destructor]|nr:Transmembrane protein 68 [Halotydeus destructor]